LHLVEERRAHWLRSIGKERDTRRRADDDYCRKCRPAPLAEGSQKWTPAGPGQQRVQLLAQLGRKSSAHRVPAVSGSQGGAEIPLELGEALVEFKIRSLRH
jgi:hypothetical protein